jgi:hypothetical protein
MFAMSRRPRNQEEQMPPIILVSPEFTQEQYEETIRKLTGGKSRVESPADWPVPGLLAHIAGQGETTFRVVDVWESEEALNRSPRSSSRSSARPA